MTGSNGKFTWYQLVTTDIAGAAAFYADVVGWAVQHGSGPGGNVTVFEAAGDGVASGGVASGGVASAMAMMDDMRQMGTPSHWLGYLAADDVDSVTECLAGAGGQVHHQPDDIDGVGRFAIVADPQGATFALFKHLPGGVRVAAPPDTPGHVGWHELNATDWPTAFAFYAALFGWTKGEAHDMGPMGVYQLFSTGADQMGGMFNRMPQSPVPFWLYYFNVADINAAAARVTRAGGAIVNGPHQVPGGQWILQCTDPQGAMFALVAPA